MPLLAVLLFVLSPARAESGSLKLALVEHPDINATQTIGDALARMVQYSSCAVVSEQDLPSYYSDGDYRFRFPNSLPEFSTSTGVLFDAPNEAALIYPPIPAFVHELKRVAEDPATYPFPWELKLSSRAVALTAFPTASGDTLLSALCRADETEAAQWHSTLVNAHRVTWRGQTVNVLVISKVFGGLGRLATALDDERKKGPLLGAARGDVLGGPLTELRGAALIDALGNLGLRVSGLGGTELRRWPELQEYRKAHPDGVQFISANLVYSSATATTLLPDHVTLEAGGLKVAFIAVTNPFEAKYLKQGGLSYSSIEDPLQAVESRVTALRAEADLVVLLADLTGPLEERLRLRAKGVDLILAEAQRFRASAEPAEASVSQRERSPFDPPLWVARDFGTATTVLDVSLKGGALSVTERHRLLDESVPNAAGYGEFDPQTFGITASTSPPLLPGAHRLFGLDVSTAARIDERKFWTMAAGLLADKTRSEVGLLRAWELGVHIDEDVPESVVRVWLREQDPALVFYLKGSDLKPLLAEAAAQKAREDKGLPIGDEIRFTAAGLDADGKLHGAAVEDQLVYKVVTSQVLSEALALSKGRDPQPVGRTVDDLVFDALRERRGADEEDYRRWMRGGPVTARGYWKVNFRDAGLIINNTKVVRDDAFNAVPNSRVQGFDQLLVGWVLKADAEYLSGPYKWSNTVEMEYARTRLAPRGQPVVTNTTANRIMALTIGTRRAGAIAHKWLAQSWGPSLGFEYDGEFEATPGLRRKNIYSALPGLQFYDGTFIRTLEVSGNIKRDESRNPPNTQEGLHFRTLFSKAVGQTTLTGAPIDVQGEIFANYFFLTQKDQAQDLRVEGDANLKLKVPIRKYLTIAPFVDFYFFEWKLKPLWGYSAMTGIQIGFSRLWKPQYEPLLGM